MCTFKVSYTYALYPRAAKCFEFTVQILLPPPPGGPEREIREERRMRGI